MSLIYYNFVPNVYNELCLYEYVSTLCLIITKRDYKLSMCTLYINSSRNYLYDEMHFRE